MCFACIPIGGSIVANLMDDTNIANNMTKYGKCMLVITRKDRKNNLDMKTDKSF